MLLPHQYPYRVVLGSASPRRKELMEKMGFDFEVCVKATDESYPASLPPLTEDRRKELMKRCKGEGETAKVTIRNTRRDANEEIKKLGKNGLPEDASKQAEKDIQDQTDKYVGKVDAMLAEKEKDIMTV